MTPTRPHHLPVLSGWTVRRLAEADDTTLELSLDLGMTRRSMRVTDAEMTLPQGGTVPLDALHRAIRAPEDCVELAADGCRKIYLYSEKTGNYYKLYQPAEDVAPTVLIGGANMHAITDQMPLEDARQKVHAFGRARGKCLDTCFGLGYSAWLLSEAGFVHVTTCEVDPNVLACAAANPWSARTMEADSIEVLHADVRELVGGSDDESFDAIFHDPPTVQQAGELYSGELYAQLRRILRRRGWLYHYVGSPGARRGRDYTRGVMRRLREAGFTDVERRARGVLARTH